MSRTYVYEHEEYPSREDCIRGIVESGDRDVDDLFMEWLYETYGGRRLWDEFAEFCIGIWTDDFMEEYFGVKVLNKNARRPAAKRKAPAGRTTASKKPAAKRRGTGARR